MIKATRRFCSPKTEKEEIVLLSETVAKNTKYNTKWEVNAFTAWQNTRVNRKVQLETVKSNNIHDENISIVFCILISKDLYQKLMNTN